MKPHREPQRQSAANPRPPKGSKLSDDRMREELRERLSCPFVRLDAGDFTSENLDVSDVSLEVQGGKVTLTGTVPERRMKRCVEDIVDACPGVQDIDNRIQVRR